MTNIVPSAARTLGAGLQACPRHPACRSRRGSGVKGGTGNGPVVQRFA